MTFLQVYWDEKKNQIAIETETGLLYEYHFAEDLELSSRQKTLMIRRAHRA
jgi:hypothetical protein